MLPVFSRKIKPNKLQTEDKLGEAAESRGTYVLMPSCPQSQAGPSCHLHQVKGLEGSAQQLKQSSGVIRSQVSWAPSVLCGSPAV